MGQYETHVFVCTTGDDCPHQGDVEGFVKYLRGEVIRKVPESEIRSAMREEVDKFLAERKAETEAV